MTSKPTILAFDTSAAHCAAALLSGGDILASSYEEMKKGQAERLMLLLQDILDDAACSYSDLDAIAVGIGPGNFTGIRISVSAARGLALGLDIPAIGVSHFDTTQHLANCTRTAVPAPRDQVYFFDSVEMQAPILTDRGALTDTVVSDAFTVTQHVETMASIGMQRMSDNQGAPQPLYVRPADAAPPRNPAPRIVP